MSKLAQTIVNQSMKKYGRLDTSETEKMLVLTTIDPFKILNRKVDPANKELPQVHIAAVVLDKKGHEVDDH